MKASALRLLDPFYEIIKNFDILKNTIVTGLKIFITNISFGVNTLLFNRSVKRLYTTIVVCASLSTIGMSNTVVFKIIIVYSLLVY